MSKRTKSQIEELSQEIDRICDQTNNNSDWTSVRDIDLYSLEQVEVFGRDKLVYLPKSGEKYELLQASRGLVYDTDVTIDEYLDKIEEEAKELNQDDKDRFHELFKHMPDFHYASNFDNFVELGFRQPRLMKYAQEELKLNAIGYDVVTANVLTAKALGYNTEVNNFSKYNKDLRFPSNSMIVSYHMIEHTHDPLAALTTIYEAMDEDSVFHVEIPLDSTQGKKETPLLNAGHLYSFEPNEMMVMLISIGFTVYYKRVSFCDSFGHYESYICSKTNKGPIYLPDGSLSENVAWTIEEHFRLCHDPHKDKKENRKRAVTRRYV